MARINSTMNEISKMDYSRIRTNFQALHGFLAELQNNMNSALPDIYSKLEQVDNSDVGQGFLSDLFWSAFNLITTIETLEGKEFIAWVLGAIVQDIHDHIDQYPDLSGEINQFRERLIKTISNIQDKIAPIISYPEKNYDKTFMYQNHTVKVSDFDTFDFIIGGVGYQKALDAVTKECKKQAVKKCFPYDKWKIAFYFGESPSNPCKQCNWGCDDWVDSREFLQDESQPIRDYNGNILANDVWEWVTFIVKQNPSRFYVVELVSDTNARFGTDQHDWKDQYPNGAFINEYCMVWGRDDFLNDWKDFDDSVGTWMFRDDGYGNVVNVDGFVDRTDFYRNWGLDAADCMWKPTPRPPDPNENQASTNLFDKVISYLRNLF